MKALALTASIASLVGAAGAAAQSSATAPPNGLSATPSGLFAPPSGLSAPPSALSVPASGLSDPGLPSISAQLVPGIATPTQPTLSAPATPSLTQSLSPPGTPTLFTTPSRSPFDASPIFVGRQLGGPSSSSSVSGGLLDSLLAPMDPFALDTLTAAPSVSVASGATFSGGGAPFDEFCRPQDFTCD